MAIQYKYVDLEAVLNYIPESIREKESRTNLLSWAFQGFRENITGRRKYMYKACLLKVKDHKATLPKGVMKIAIVEYSTNEPSCLKSVNLDPVTFVNHANEEDYRVVLQQLLTLDNDCMSNFKLLSYKGQDSELLHGKCPNLYCKSCELGFSISRDMRTITLDISSGWLCVVYKTLTEKNNKLQIPDDSGLLRAMGLFAVSQYWLNRTVHHEPTANQNYQYFLSSAAEKFSEANSKALMRAYDPLYHEEMIFGRFRLQHHPSISGKYRNRFSR